MQPMIAAGAGLSAVDQIGMAQLDAVVHAAVEHFAVQDDASAKPRAECQQNARFAADKRTLIEFGQCSAVGVIGDINRDAGKLLLQESAQRNIVEIQIVRVKNRLSARVDAAGDDCTERFYAGKRRVPLFQQRKNCRTDFFRHVHRRCVRKWDGCFSGQFQRLVQQADLDVGAADINADLIHVCFPFSLILRLIMQPE